MRKRIGSLFLMLSLLLPPTLLAQQGNTQRLATSPPAASAPPSTEPQNFPLPSRRDEAARRRSYERETRTRRHRRVSKGEIVFMAAIAGTSMGIGALAGGAEGLAVGSIVGGWGAYAGHRLWKWIK